MGLFALSPLPSAQLFVAAGLVDAPLVPLIAAFFAGRLVSYTIYVTAASSLVALLRVDWAQILTGHRGLHDGERHAAEPSQQVPRRERPHVRHGSHTRTPPAPSTPPTDDVSRSPHA